MKGLRLLNNGEWNKAPVLTAARQVFALGLADRSPQCTLGDAASFLNGTNYDVDRLSTLAPLPIIRISNLTDPTSTYLRTDEDLGAKFWIRPGDLLVSWSASFKSAIWSGPEGYLNQHIFKVTENSGFDRRYIRHIIEASFDAMRERVVGIGMMHLRRADFLGQRVPAPPMGVQTAVAAYLDWLEGGRVGIEPALPSELAKQRQLVTRIEKLAAQIQEARSLRYQATSEVGTLAAAAEIHHSLIPLGDKFGWEPLGLVARVQGGYAFKSEELQDYGVPVVKIANVSDGRLDWSTRTYISESRLGEFQQFAIEEDDFLIAMTRPVIRGAIKVARVNASELPCLLNQRVGRFQCIQDRMSREFLFRVLLSQYFRREVETRCEGGQQPNIGTKELESIPIPVPPLAEQRHAVAYLDGLQGHVDAVKSLQSETAAELDALLPAILDRAFKGELV